MVRKTTITVASHHFTVAPATPHSREATIEFTRGLVQWRKSRRVDGSMDSVPFKTFADADKHKSVYRFHIEILDDFIKFIKDRGVGYDVLYREMYTPAVVDFKLNSDNYSVRDYQEPLVNYICGDGYKKVITLQTGRGKTAVFLFAIARLAVRTALVISPKYFERWAQVMTDGLVDKPMLHLKAGKDILMVRGGKSLRNVISLAQAGELNVAALLISADTYFNYLNDCRDPDEVRMFYDVRPDRLWETLAVGVVGIDEGHENFHANFKLDLHSHVPKTVTLSATLTPDDPFLKRMFQILYPNRLRMNGGEYVRYADMDAVPYSWDINLPKPKVSWRGRSDYSQLAYEFFLVNKKNKLRYDRVLDMLIDDIDNVFLARRVEGHRLLIFFDSVEMCTKVAEDLAKRYPHLAVNKYTSDEAYEILETLDIIVATTKSADTGVDVSKLQMCFCFVARGSSIANEQMFGRLRQLKVEGVRPLFVYYYCMNCPQHINYHEKREEFFAGKTVTFSVRQTHHVI